MAELQLFAGIPPSSNVSISALQFIGRSELANLERWRLRDTPFLLCFCVPCQLNTLAGGDNFRRRRVAAIRPLGLEPQPPVMTRSERHFCLEPNELVFGD